MPLISLEVPIKPGAFGVVGCGSGCDAPRIASAILLSGSEVGIGVLVLVGEVADGVGVVSFIGGSTFGVDWGINNTMEESKVTIIATVIMIFLVLLRCRLHFLGAPAWVSVDWPQNFLDLKENL